MGSVGASVERAMLENWRKLVAENPHPERFISTCEWCGRDTVRYGRWELRSGEGLCIILCTICASFHKPSIYLEEHNFGQEIVKV